MLRQPALAATLRRLATDGPRAFYEGPIADALVHDSGAPARYGIAAPYVLSVGTLEPRKNLAFLFEWFLGSRGLPGSIDQARLVRISMKIGLGESARFMPL